jgi:2,3-dihydro-2,3-dihydroxybenzoate dehydrogenase
MTAFNFTAQVIWVTGAGQGIGKHLATSLSALGATVVGLDKHFQDMDYPYATHIVDLAQPAEVMDICQTLLQQHPRLDGLVNVAGVLTIGALENLSIKDWQHCFDVNVSGAFYLLKNIIPRFKAQRQGVIVSVASNAAHIPRQGMAAYGASKAALVSLTHSVGLELSAFGIRANVVSPGSTHTPMLTGMLNGDPQAYQSIIDGLPEDYKLGIPLRKIATEQDITNTILFLLSPLSGHITLQDIVVDGGATLGA